MQLRILNCKHYANTLDGVKPLKVWISPDQNYMVAEVFHSEYFIAGKIIEKDDEADVLIVDCTDEFGTESDEIDYRSYSVDWSNMIYGFCKLRFRSLESFETRSYRIYFDPDLYKRKYEEINGTPYDGKKKFHR